MCWRERKATAKITPCAVICRELATYASALSRKVPAQSYAGVILMYLSYLTLQPLVIFFDKI